MSDGLTDKEIARQLGLQPDTVSEYVAAVLKKLDAPN
ncbi:MAG: LuxR C-terminal-related transcriptional regulator [Dehalococcoidia bacterium]|nr:LuxR C-terminal-related transcriptional regulator [Dehalococcoidia bacterium]